MKRCLILPVKNTSLIEMTVERREILMWPLDTDSLIKLAHLYLADWGKVVREEFSNPKAYIYNALSRYLDLFLTHSCIAFSSKVMCGFCLRIWLKRSILGGSIIKESYFLSQASHWERFRQCFDGLWWSAASIDGTIGFGIYNQLYVLVNNGNQSYKCTGNANGELSPNQQ